MLKAFMLICLATSATAMSLKEDDQTHLDEVSELFRDYFRWKLANNPHEASLMGFQEFENQVYGLGPMAKGSRN